MRLSNSSSGATANVLIAGATLLSRQTRTRPFFPMRNVPVHHNVIDQSRRAKRGNRFEQLIDKIQKRSGSTALLSISDGSVIRHEDSFKSLARENNFDLVTPLTVDDPAGGKLPHPLRSVINPGGTIKRRGDPLAQNDETDLLTPLTFDPAVRNLPPPLRRGMNWGGRDMKRRAVAATREQIVRGRVADLPTTGMPDLEIRNSIELRENTCHAKCKAHLLSLASGHQFPKR
jgi:hypothetical protein